MAHDHEFRFRWPFSEAPNTEAYSTRQVLENLEPILLVTHDLDGDWQILCGTTNEAKDGRLVCLGCMLLKDPTIAEVAALPLGWRAWRKDAQSSWIREVHPGHADEREADPEEGAEEDARAYSSAVSDDGTLAAFFEDDGRTGYFYLMDLRLPRGEQITDAFWIYNGDQGLTDDSIRVAWTPDGRYVGLLIRETVWLVYDTHTRVRFGAPYSSATGNVSTVPLELQRLFGQ